jgi:lysophospholipase L1-like esterase
VNPGALAPFHAALASSDHPLVRILHFGDSHTACDYWSGRVRARLQARFGNGGPGLILPSRPWRGYRHDGVEQVTGVGWPGESLRSRECSGLVGLAGAAMFPPPGEPFRLRAAFTEYRIHVLGAGGEGAQARTLAVPDAGPLALPPLPLLSHADPQPVDQELSLPEGRLLRIFGEKGLGSPARRELTVTFPEDARLLGVDLLTGRPGVVYDELGLNGAEILDLDRWNPDLRRTLLDQVRPDLLVLAYGTNDLGRPDLDLADYRARTRRLLVDLKRESNASILVVGPLDRQGAVRKLRPFFNARARQVVQALREVAQAAGCAFWDARQAMGGEGAILQWRRQGLAQKDLVHLTGPGYQRLGDRLVEALLKGL